ncbi:MAG: serine/threonine-protein kinase, partial [Planctomycetota bacterium]
MAEGDAWDGAFKEAFKSESVLEQIERRTGTQSRILLRDPPREPTPVVRVPTGEEVVPEDARYRVLGEIARGGIGVIYKGHDHDLGRDVALKVLRADRAGWQDILDRFVEEAQVSGQLQHPGVVPVYSLGVSKDGRPF